MHEYIEIQFRRKNKPFPISRQVSGGFEFEEPDPPTRSIDVGFSPFGDATEFRMRHIRQVKGWGPQEFRLQVSVEDGSLILRGDDKFSLPEGFYNVTANVDSSKVKKKPPRVEVKHDSHGVVTVDLELDERTIDVDISKADTQILDVLARSMIDGQPGTIWIDDDDVRPTRRACALNLLANLRVFPSLSKPLIADVTCLIHGGDERTYAQVTPNFCDRITALSEEHDLVFPEGQPHAKIHELLLKSIDGFDPAAVGVFLASGLRSFRAEGGPSLQMVITTEPQKTFASRFVDLDLDLGNPLQDIAGFVVHIGELLDGKPTNHLDLWKKLKKGKSAPYLYYKVVA
jgi:hypothetical protein